MSDDIGDGLADHARHRLALTAGNVCEGALQVEGNPDMKVFGAEISRWRVGRAMNHAAKLRNMKSLR